MCMISYLRLKIIIIFYKNSVTPKLIPVRHSLGSKFESYIPFFSLYLI